MLDDDLLCLPVCDSSSASIITLKLKGESFQTDAGQRHLPPRTLHPSACHAELPLRQNQCVQRRQSFAGACEGRSRDSSGASTSGHEAYGGLCDMGGYLQD